MALGFAVALCGLLILESIRREAQLVNQFYRLLQDPTKDVAEGMILSHLCLILGCAVPLWLGLAMEERIGHQMLLRHWGILCLGVGDAMAAVIGKTYGRFRWGRNRRTLEGSVAMWISMIVGGGLVVDQWSLLLEATTLATLLEAFTTDMDNLILPLAGSIWIVLRLLVD
jgi:dolichol kinase